VLLNLIRNAAEAMADVTPTTREVEVSTSLTAPGQITVSTTDSGRPIDEAAFERLFQQFYTTKREGLGVGLAISRSIVEAHGGCLWAERRAERGLVMRFTLPVAMGSPVGREV
jgi:two-component system sensor kinase FixL